MMIQMEAEASKYPDLELVILNAHNDNELQNRQIDSLIRMGVDLLIISPNESEPVTPAAVRAFRSGIPTIISDRKIDSEEYTCFISADNYSIGRDVGKYIKSFLKPGSNILEIEGLRGSSPAIERHKGFMDEINGHYSIRHLEGDWRADITAARMQDIPNYSGIDLVFGHNDDMALAAYEAIRSRSLSDARRIKFIGIDAVVGVDAVIDGRLDASFLYPPGGDFVIQKAMDILTGKQIEKTYVLKSSIINSSNATTLKAQSEQLLNYQNHINAQRSQIDQLNGNYAQLKKSLWLVIAILVIMAVIATIALVMSLRALRKNRAITELSEQKLRFFTNLSHEIRTPLTLILSPLDKIERSISDTALRSDISIIQKNARHLQKIVNQILDFRKIQNDKMALTVSQTDIVPFVGEIVKYFEVYAHSENIIYKFSSDTPSCALWFDRDKMEQVFINLISNAFKNSSKYGEIDVKIHDNDQWIIIEVHDNGRGIDTAAQQQIFDRFYSNPPSSRKDGAGIGLHLSKEYVEMHSGRISVTSEVGKYTSFYVELRKGKDHFGENVAYSVPEESAVLPQEDETSVNELLSKRYDYTVLIAEDDEDIRSYLTQELSQNFHVLSASNGYEAATMAQEKDVSLVLSDVLMPQINGFQLCRGIKTNIATSHIPVILLTALTDDAHRIYGIAEGADEYIRKPFNIDYLKVKIIRTLDERKQLQASFMRKYETDKVLDLNIDNGPCIDDLFRRKIAEYLGSSYTDGDATIEQMSSELCMSRVQLYRKVKTLFGMSPTDLIRNYRLSRARALLSSGMSIAEVADATGFSTQAYFAKCFRSLYGMSPTQFKKKHE